MSASNVKTNSLPEAVIFDMDGVLVESEPYLRVAGVKVFEELGLQVQGEDFKPFIGTGEDRYLGGVAETYNFPLDTGIAKKRLYEIYFEMLDGKLEPLNGVVDFVHTCKRMNKKIAVASSADLPKIIFNLRNIGLEKDFDAIVSGDDVEKKKPDPSIFLLAAKKLGIDIARCLVVEDAISGVQAAKSAGSKCLGLTTSFSADALSKADWIAPDLSDVDPQVLNWK